MSETIDKKRLAKKSKLYYKICRNCGARNSTKAEKCRKCKHKNLRWKKREVGMKK